MQPLLLPFVLIRWSRAHLFAGWLCAVATLAIAARSDGASCVWKVTDAKGHTLYLAGSFHALRATDYPLPASYDQAYAASSAVAFEDEEAPRGKSVMQALGESATYPNNGCLKDHVDPRTYAYLLQVLGKAKGASHAEAQIEHYKAWALAFMVESPNGIPGVSSSWGVESSFLRRAKHDHKDVGGLVSFKEHVAVFARMNDTDAEATLLLAFIHAAAGSSTYPQMVAAWKRGDTETIRRLVHAEFADAASLQQHMLSERNLRWIPRLEDWLKSGKTWLVIAGTGHMVGDNGVPSLLRARGYKVEQM